MDNIKDDSHFNVYAFVAAFVMLGIVVQSFILENSVLGIIIICITLIYIRQPQFYIPIVFISAILGDRCIIVSEYSAIRVFTIIFILIMISRIVYYKSLLFPKGNFYYFFILVTYIFVSQIVVSENSISEYFTTMVLNVGLTLLIVKVNFNYLKIYRLFMIGGIIYVLMLFYALNAGLGAVFIDVNGTLSLQDGINNNVIAQGLAQVGAMLSAGMIICGIRRKKPLFLMTIVFFCISLLLVFLLGSRSAFIAMIVVFAIALMKVCRIKGIRKLLVPMGLLVILVLSYILDKYWLLLQRFTIDNVLASGGSHRTEIWDVVWHHIVCENPILGVGFGPENIVSNLRHYGIVYSGTHNLYLDIWGQMGLIGELLFLVGIIVILINLYKNRKIQYWSWFPFLMIIASCVNGIGENIFLGRVFWMNIGMGLVLSKKCDYYG